MKTVEEIKEEIKDKLIYLKLDILEFLGHIEMFIKRIVHIKFYNSLSIENIPKNTLYCYDGCRLVGVRCPYFDRSVICGDCYCHYKKRFEFSLLNDECKICGIGEDLEDNEDDTDTV